MPCCAPREDHTRPTVPPFLYARPAFIEMLGQECTATFLLRFHHVFSIMGDHDGENALRSATRAQSSQRGVDGGHGQEADAGDGDPVPVYAAPRVCGLARRMGDGP